MSAVSNVMSPRPGLPSFRNFWLPMLTEAGQLYRPPSGYPSATAGGRGDLERRSRRVLTLRGPIEDRLPVLGAEQVVELLLRDAAGPHARVVVRVAGHGHDPAGGGQHDRRALVGGVPFGPGPADRAVEGLLDVGLDLRVDAGHQVIAGDRRGLADGAGDVAGGVDRHHLGPGLAAELGVVLGLQAGLADQVHA